MGPPDRARGPDREDRVHGLSGAAGVAAIGQLLGLDERRPCINGGLLRERRRGKDKRGHGRERGQHKQETSHDTLMNERPRQLAEAVRMEGGIEKPALEGRVR